MRSEQRFWSLCVAALICAPALANPNKAQDPQQSAPTQRQSRFATVEELARINEEIALLSAEIKRAELQAELAKKKAEAKTTALPPPPNLPSASAPLPSTMIVEPPEQPMPVVRGLEGVGDKLRVILVYAGGVSIVASEGDAILDGWRIDRITERSVSVVKGKERRLLAFGREVPPNQQPTVIQTVPAPRL